MSGLTAARQRRLDEDAELRTMSPAEFGAYLRSDGVRWTKVIRDAGVVT